MEIVENKGQKFALVLGANANDINSLTCRREDEGISCISRCRAGAARDRRKLRQKLPHINGLPNKVAELETKYSASNTRQQSNEVAVADHQLQKPKDTPVVPQLNDNVREVA